MPQFRIHRLKDHLRANFRFAPHLSGTASVKPRDYETSEDAVVEATTPYAAFFALREAVQPIQVGDVLECEDGSLRIFKFVGIEEAQWILPESPRPEAAQQAGQPSTAS
jgi:hypothetical protein